MKLSSIVLFVISQVFQWGLFDFNLAKASDSTYPQWHVGVGEKLNLKASSPIQLPKNKLIQVTDLGHSVQIRGKKAGSTWIQLGETKHLIHVLSHKQNMSRQRLQQAAKRTLGLKLNIQEGLVLVEGNLVRAEDWMKMAEACSAINCEYQAKFQIAAEVFEKSKKLILQSLQQKGIQTHQLRWQNGFTVLGSAKLNKADIQSIQNFGLQYQYNAKLIDSEPVVRVQITLAEVKRDEFQKLGLQWPEVLQAQLWPNWSTSEQSALMYLHALEKQGLSRTLASPSLISKSGKSAEFVAGGEIPIKVLNYRNSHVEWKRYGIVLKIKPMADSTGHMSIFLETEVSSLDMASAIDGVPGLFTNKIQSHFDLSSSKTILLSGLIKSEEGKNSQGIPGLMNIPILGSLFSSKDFKSNKTELVVLVTPEIINFDM